MMKRVARLSSSFVLLACGAGCTCMIPTPGRYGMTRSQMEQTWSVAREVTRNSRVRASQYARNGYEVSLPSFRRYAVEQQGRDFCWAACIQMVSAYDGIRVEQRDVVERIKGKVSNDGNDAGSVMDIVEGLSGPWRSTFVSNGVSNWMVADLLADSPSLLGLRPPPGRDVGHVVVLTGAKFGYGPNGEKICYEFTVFDPADGQPYVMEAEELCERLGFVVSFRSAG